MVNAKIEGIFGGYDVRGIYGANLTEREAGLLGKAYGTFLAGVLKKSETKRPPKIVLGRDNRTHSKSLRDAFVEGITSTGCSVFDAGVVPSPVAYFACWALKTDGAAVITASHNSPKYNGVKMLNGIWPLSSRELYSVEKTFSSRQFLEKPRSAWGRVSSQQNVLEEYFRFVSTKLSKLDGLKVVIDGGNGIVGSVAVKLFRKLGAKVVPLYCEPDGTFPNHLPDPSKQENLVDLQKKVLAERADLGIAYDGDGDRAVFVDEKGKIISSDAANVLFIREVLESLPRGETVGFELRCSMAVAEEIASLGGIPFETRAGRIAVRETIREGAVFACETTGHVCFAENNGFDDGLFASAKLAWLVKSKAAAASKLAASVKTYFSTRELRIPCEIKDEAVETVKKSLSSQNLKLSTADGVKYADASAWGLVRASQTEPLLSARFEGKTQKDLQSVYDLFARAFPASIKLPSLESIMQN